MKYKIERDVPIGSSSRVGATKYPDILDAMEALKVGDSFFVPKKEVNSVIVRKYVHANRDRFAGKRKFATHVTDGGIRVGRVELALNLQLGQDRQKPLKTSDILKGVFGQVKGEQFRRVRETSQKRPFMSAYLCV